MTAVFGTPRAAILLAVELLLFELRPRSLLPVALACTVAGFLRPLWAEAGPLFAMQTPPADTIALVSCVVAGLACGMLCTAMSSILYKVEDAFGRRSEEHTSELQSLMRISYAVFCLKKKT